MIYSYVFSQLVGFDGTIRAYVINSVIENIPRKIGIKLKPVALNKLTLLDMRG